jgi:hypothetical protein
VLRGASDLSTKGTEDLETVQFVIHGVLLGPLRHAEAPPGVWGQLDLASCHLFDRVREVPSGGESTERAKRELDPRMVVRVTRASRVVRCERRRQSAGVY